MEYSGLLKSAHVQGAQKLSREAYMKNTLSGKVCSATQ